MDSKRRCTKSSCGRPAVATLTYSYADSTMVVGPISVYAEPHTYDLCTGHADAVSPPRGWEALRLDYSRNHADEADDLLALADAVREPRAPRAATNDTTASSDNPRSGRSGAGTLVEDTPSGAREPRAPLAPPAGDPGIARGHLRLLRD